jgi:hypothetical protein
LQGGIKGGIFFLGNILIGNELKNDLVSEFVRRNEDVYRKRELDIFAILRLDIVNANHSPVENIKVDRKFLLETSDEIHVPRPDRLF